MLALFAYTTFIIRIH